MSESKERRGGRNAYIRGRKAKGSHTKSSKNDAKKDCILDLVKQLYKETIIDLSKESEETKWEHHKRLRRLIEQVILQQGTSVVQQHTDQTSFRSLIEWVKHHKGVVSVKHFDGMGRGLYAAELISADDVLLRIPK
eukprot:gene6500-309_t